MPSFIYDQCIFDAFQGRINFNGDAFKVAFATKAYRPDKENDARRSDILDEVEGQGYDKGGMAVEVHAALANGALNLALGGLEIPSATISARYAVYFVDRGGAPEDDELVACIDFGGDVTSSNGKFALTASSLRFHNPLA